MGVKKGRDKKRSHAKSKRMVETSYELSRVLSNFEAQDLLALVEAAASSPTAAHKLPTLSVIFFETLKYSPHGARPLAARDLSTLVEEVHKANPNIWTLEDFVPPDPRDPVKVRWGCELFRLVPGALERPIAVVEKARLVAGVVDDTLVTHLGFGLSDLVELVLRHVDHAAEVLAGEWKNGIPGGHDVPPTISSGELDAARRVRSISDAVEHCSFPERAEKALRWATAKLSRFQIALGDPNATFGPVLAVQLPNGEVRTLPAALCVEALNCILTKLAETAGRLDSSLHERFSLVANERIKSLLRRTRQPIMAPVTIGGCGEIHSLVAFGRNSLLAVGVAPILFTGNHKQVESAIDRLEGLTPGISVDTPQGALTIPANTRIVKVLVVVSPAHVAVRTQKGMAGVSLEDLEWIINASAASPDDVLLFFDEFSNQPDLGMLITFEAINAFEHWRSNGKCLHRSGEFIQLALLELHRGDAEWYQAADRVRLEESLLDLGLDNVAQWDVIEVNKEKSEAKVGRTLVAEAWSILMAPVTVGIRVFDSSTPVRFRSLLGSVGTAIEWRLQHANSAFGIISTAISPTKALRLLMLYYPDASLPPIRLFEATGNQIIVAWDDRIYQPGEAHVASIERMLGEVIAQGLSILAGSSHSALSNEFLSAWSSSPPGLRIDAIAVEQQVTDLPSPETPHPTFKAQFQRELGKRIREHGIQPGIFDRAESQRIESMIVYPALMAIFEEVTTPFRASAILDTATRELEYAWAQRFTKEQRLIWNQGFPVISFDPVSVAMTDREHGSLLCRSLALILEEQLRKPSGGNMLPDRLDWGRILSVAELCLESGLRSENLYYGLVPLRLRISDTYEISLQASDEQAAVDIRAYQVAQTRATLPQFGGDGRTQRSSASETEPQSQSILATLPALQGIDRELRRFRGYGIDALLKVLYVLRAWPVSRRAPVGRTKVPDIVKYCTNQLGDLPVEEITQALGDLCLRGSDLQGPMLEHWEQERRRVRLLTRPLVVLDNEVVCVMPWLIEGTLRVFTMYLDDGRLPWPNDSLAPDLVQGLSDYRSRRNQQLEKEIVSTARQLGLKADGNFKKPAVLGIDVAAWAGEIDAIAVDDRRSIIWVIEAKDPYTSFSAAQTDRLLRQFHRDPDYVGKLLRKTDSVTSNTSGVATSVKASDPARQWSVIPLMVTRRTEPAAFVREPRVKFCTIDELASLLRS